MPSVFLPAEIDFYHDQAKKKIFLHFILYIDAKSLSTFSKVFIFNKYLCIYGVSKGTCQGGFV